VPDYAPERNTTVIQIGATLTKTVAGKSGLIKTGYQLNQCQFGCACAQADMASNPATVKARIRVNFMGFSLARVGGAYENGTVGDARLLQLLCNYYLVYTPGHK
jgi:hypothetical protein